MLAEITPSLKKVITLPQESILLAGCPAIVILSPRGEESRPENAIKIRFFTPLATFRITKMDNWA